MTTQINLNSFHHFLLHSNVYFVFVRDLKIFNGAKNRNISNNLQTTSEIIFVFVELFKGSLKEFNLVHRS